MSTPRDPTRDRTPAPEGTYPGVPVHEEPEGPPPWDRVVSATDRMPSTGEGPGDEFSRGGGLTGGKSTRFGDRLFRGMSVGSAAFVLVIMAAIAVFLIWKAIPALNANEANFFSYEQWFPNGTPPMFGIAALAFGTVATSILAIIIAVPIAVGVALFISNYAPIRVAQGLGYIVDLLAAVPSVVYGLWGYIYLNDHIKDTSAFLDKYFGWTVILSSNSGVGPYGRSILLASVVLAIMILPIVAAISREVFLQVPTDHKEAALALGATRWEMVRTAVLPYGRPGVISATMLGLGRALGETIAVAMVLSATFTIDWHFLSPGGNTIAANIANQFAEANDTGRGALIASGLVLFVITLIVNFAARWIIARRKEFSGAAS
jgi:phosphate transport system permease protein